MSGMPDANFYAHQHSQSSGDVDTVVPLSSMFTVANGAGGVEHAREGVRISVGNLMSPYKPPKRRLQDNPEKVLCANDGCKAFPMKAGDHGLCTGHARSAGLIENWKRAGRDGDTG
jgi:hypothetical protein